MFIADLPPDPALTSTEVVVVGRTNVPMWEAGAMVGYVLLLARTPADAVEPFYMIYMSASEPQPNLGSRCTFWHRPARVGGTVGGLETLPDLTGELVDRFDCDPPATPPPPRPFT